MSGQNVISANGLAPIKVADTSGTSVNTNPAVPYDGITFGKNGFGTYMGNTYYQDKNGNVIQVKTPISPWAQGLQTGAQAVNAVAAGLNAYTGWKGLGLAQKQFDFTKNATNRDIANKARLANNEITNANDVGLALGSGAMTADQIAASKAATQDKLLNGSAIG